MTTGFAMRDMHHRHAVVAREAEPAPAPVPPVQVVRRKRNNSKRCKASGSISSALPTATAPPENAGDKPPVFSSSATEAQTTATPEPPKETPTPEPPKATSSQAPPPPPPPAKTTTKDAPPTPTNSGGSGEVFSGDGTFYATGLGSCGITNSDTDFIAAVSHLLYDSWPGYNGVNPNNNPICGKKATAHYQGKQVTITVTDRCTGCALHDLDFSPTAFDQIADPSVGRIHGMTWSWDD
jgi:hypothetical protein